MAKQPLPTKEEYELQLAQEAVRKRIELDEEQAALADRMRERHHEERLKFRDELREILAMGTKKAGPEIDALVNRTHGDRDPKVFGRAIHVWRFKHATAAVRINELRALDIPESDILELISDTLNERMHSRGGPRDSNEVRVRAARQLLNVELQEAAAAPPVGNGTINALKAREPSGGRRPQ